MYNSIRNLGLAAIICVTLIACGEEKFTVNTSFSNLQDVTEGAPVMFDGQLIGEVSKVESAENIQNVELTIDPLAAEKIKANAAVMVNRMEQNSPLEIYNRNTPSEELLLSGQSLKGLDSMFELGAWMVGDALKIGAGTVSDYVEGFQEYLQSDKFQQDKDLVREQIDTARTAAESAIAQVESDLNRAADEFVASEGAAAQAIEQLGEELAPLLEDLAGGGADIAAQLEKFAAEIESSNPERQEAGKKLVESLIATLEKLNQAMEEETNNLESNNLKPNDLEKEMHTEKDESTPMSESL